MLAPTYAKPYYAVIFTSCRTDGDLGYHEMAEKTVKLVQQEEGFLGADSWRDEQGAGVTISYWESLASIEKWKNNTLHNLAKEKGREQWYSQYTIRICKVEDDGFFPPVNV